MVCLLQQGVRRCSLRLQALTALVCTLLKRPGLVGVLHSPAALPCLRMPPRPPSMLPTTPISCPHSALCFPPILRPPVADQLL